jgi:hypothetical protein
MTKGIGDKVLGWFIVDEDAKPDAQEQSEAAEPAAPPPATPPRDAKVVSSPPIVAPGASHDASAFAAVYRAAGVADGERERLARVVGLLESLPAEASMEVKRAIVAASLEAFGVPIDRILVTGEGALGALDGYVAGGEQRTREVLEQAEARIARLTNEIAEVRRLMEVQVAAQQDLVRATGTERARIRVALDFFGGGGGKKGLRLVG